MGQNRLDFTSAAEFQTPLPPPPPPPPSTHPPPGVLFEIQCPTGHPGSSTEFKTGHPPLSSLHRPHKETEGAMTKYMTPPPALRSPAQYVHTHVCVFFPIMTLFATRNP